MKLTTKQKTTVPVIDPKKQKWFIVDVKGKTLGRVATKIADMLRGKLKPIFTPQHDCGDYVVVVNARHIRLAGSKPDKKMYQWHTQFPGGFREITARKLLDEKPEEVIYQAVWGMLPRNKLRSKIIKKLRIFGEEAHDHTAQHPTSIEI